MQRLVAYRIEEAGVKMTQDVNCRYVDGVFSPLEVEAMTGVSPVLQRTWKQRGFLVQNKTARASLSVREVAQIATLQIASQGVPVELAYVREAAAAAVPSILWFASSDKEAWEIQGSTEQKAAFRRGLASANKSGLMGLDKALGVTAQNMGRYVVLHSNEYDFVNELEAVFEAEDTPVSLILDLFAIANRLVRSPKRRGAMMVATDIEVGAKRPDLPFPPGR